MPSIKPPEVSEVTGCVKRYTKRLGVTVSIGIQQERHDGIIVGYEEHHEYRQMVGGNAHSHQFHCIFCLHERIN